MKLLIALSLSIFPFTGAVTTEEATALCDFVASSDITRYHREWMCSNGVPVSPPCAEEATSLSWYGLACNEKYSVYKWELYDLEGNVSGTLPDTIGNLRDMTTMIFQVQNLSGTLPSSIGQWSQMDFLQISDTSLTGTLPEEISNLSKLTHLNLINSQFTGSIPSSYGNLKSLRSTTYCGNKLTGPIPDTFGTIQNLTALYFFNNYFSGTVPASLCELTPPYVDLHLTSDKGEASVENPNIECYPACLKKIYKLVANGIPVCEE